MVSFSLDGLPQTHLIILMVGIMIGVIFAQIGLCCVCIWCCCRDHDQTTREERVRDQRERGNYAGQNQGHTRGVFHRMEAPTARGNTSRSQVLRVTEATPVARGNNSRSQVSRVGGQITTAVGNNSRRHISSLTSDTRGNNSRRHISSLTSDTRGNNSRSNVSSMTSNTRGNNSRRHISSLTSNTRGNNSHSQVSRAMGATSAAMGNNSRCQVSTGTGSGSVSPVRVDIAVVEINMLPPPYTSVVTSQEPQPTPDGLPSYDEVVGNSAVNEISENAAP
ncbi:hypothetical protein BaRGS_00037576 [Batillaria attramentaria]|uniref:Uncharacterized protein n=1 Tax=Batillaria attramentaria TaxID=370345 RepID=A0ABD0J9M1_9CAEN